MTTDRRTRLPLGRTRHRLSFERRLRLWMFGLALPMLAATAALAYREADSWVVVSVSVGLALIAWSVITAYFFEGIVRPLQTLANVVAALREDDFSFRARGGRRGDALGDLALEVNALAATLQHQRSSALEAITLVERVLTSMQSPVFAFDEAGKLQLMNAAAATAFDLDAARSQGRTADELGLAALLTVADRSLYPAPDEAGLSTAAHTRWSVRRTRFRLHGEPNTLLVLSDVAAALREEERRAWQRLIRVLSHEINNTLTPVHSIAGSLRTRLLQVESTVDVTPDLVRGLGVIEDRAASLHRFLQSYQQLTSLPVPRLRPVNMADLIDQVSHMETRLRPSTTEGPEVTLLCDSDQVQQALINLLRNAVDAALIDNPHAIGEHFQPCVTMTWRTAADTLMIVIEDNGPGIANASNLFVPFYTTKTEGSGIGLLLCQQIALAHHGSIELASRESGHGCRAVLTLPITHTEATPLTVA